MIVLQHNCNSTAATTTAALEAAIERRAEVVILQEPYVGRKHQISHPGFQIRWPEGEKREIRVALAIRVDVLDTYIFEERTDLIDHPCVQCLDIWETQRRQKVRMTRVVNIYNRARMNGGGYAINRIDFRQLIQGRTILAGDFNSRSPAWDPWVEGRHNAGATEDLIGDYSLIVNNTDQPTRCGPRSKSVIDLTLSTPGVGALQTWYIDEDFATPSDHAVIIFSWSPLSSQASGLEARPMSNWNIDELCSDGERLKQATDHWRQVSESRQRIAAEATEDDLEAKAQWIQDSLTTVLNRHAPPKPIHARSKRWWADKVKDERKKFNVAKRALREEFSSQPEYRRIRNDYYSCVRRAKREAWERFLEAMLPTDEEAQTTADNDRCWRALRYINPQTPSYTPAIRIIGDDGELIGMAASAEEKEEIFMKQAFPYQASTNADNLIPDTIADVGKRDVQEALFAQSVKKAPGVDKLGFRALRLLWQWDADGVVALIRGCITAGYHPHCWKIAKGILLRKQGQPTYTVARAYRVISLLNCLGKVAEKVAATWIASYCEKNETFHQGQFGCRHGRSTSDAVARLVSFVEDAWERKQIVLTLLLDVKGAFDRVNKHRLLERLIGVGIAGNIVRWVKSFLSDKRAMLVIDGRTGKTHDIQAGLPQGSPASPVLFNLSISAMFSSLEEMHTSLEAISFVDDIGLVLKCNKLGEGARELESIAQHAVEWGDRNKVEFEISKTEVVVFSKQRKVLQESREASFSIGEHELPINRGATKWLGFWLDPKLSFKSHFDKRLASAKGALQRIKGLSGSRGGLTMRLMRRVVVAAVNSVALYGAEVWWRGQQDRSKRLQLLLNSQARAITGMLLSTPIPTLLSAACLPRAEELLDYRQTRFAVRALAAAQDHPTHQLLPPNFRMGQLYRHEGAVDRLSSVGWLSPDKTHRTLGGRLAQQIAKKLAYDTEYGFGLLEDLGSPETGIEVRVRGPDVTTTQRRSGGQPERLTLFARAIDGTTEGNSFGAGVAWEAQGCWRTKTASLGRYLSVIDAELFAISMAVGKVGSSLRETGKQNAEIVTTSRDAVIAVTRLSRWVPPLVKQVANQTKQLKAQGHNLTLSPITVDAETEGMRIADSGARRAARQQPRHVRSASLSYVQQCVKVCGRLSPKLNKRISDANKAVATRYLQLKSGHAMTGVHLMRTKRVHDARCWWCNDNRQSVAHLMLKCRKWRRERERMLHALEAKKIKISTRRNEQDVLVLFGETAVEAVLRFIECTAVGKRAEANSTQRTR